MSGRHGLRANRLVPMGQSSRHERQDKGRSGGRDDPGHVVAFSRGGGGGSLAGRRVQCVPVCRERPVTVMALA